MMNEGYPCGCGKTPGSVSARFLPGHDHGLPTAIAKAVDGLDRLKALVEAQLGCGPEQLVCGPAEPGIDWRPDARRTGSCGR